MTSTDFNPDQTELVTEILERLGVLSEGEVPSSGAITTIQRTLNLVLKSWQNKHTFLHTRQWVQKTFSASSYVTGSDGKIYTCILSHTSSTLNKPVTGANYTTFWQVRGDAGGTWTDATSYISAGDFNVAADTVGIEEAFIRDGGYDYSVKIKPLSFFGSILDKANTGRPYILAFDKQLIPKIYLYYHPDKTDYVLHYLRTRRILDFDAVSDTADLPPETLEALICAATYRASFKYGKPMDERYLLRTEAEKAYREMRRGEIHDGNFIKGAF